MRLVSAPREAGNVTLTAESEADRLLLERLDAALRGRGAEPAANLTTMLELFEAFCQAGEGGIHVVRIAG